MADKFFQLIENVIKWLFLRVLRISITEEKIENWIEFGKFGIIGLTNTVISYVIYVLSLWSFQSIGILPKVDYLIAQLIGFISSVLWSFYWNNKFVFKEKNGGRNWMYTLFKTYISYAFTGLFLNSLLSVMWVEVLHWSKMIAPVINLLISVPLNFLINKFWAFKNK